MNSRELAQVMATAAGIELWRAQKALGAIAPAVVATCRKGGSVRLGSLGTFGVQRQHARTYKDLRTKQTVTVPQKMKIVFNIAQKKKHI